MSQSVATATIDFQRFSRRGGSSTRHETRHGFFPTRSAALACLTRADASESYSKASRFSSSTLAPTFQRHVLRDKHDGVGCLIVADNGALQR
jgi:hypothetical protein